ncbi:period circadian protein homolog 3 isoform X1, partial [Tachysurus ichikawai]
ASSFEISFNPVCSLKKERTLKKKQKFQHELVGHLHHIVRDLIRDCFMENRRWLCNSMSSGLYEREASALKLGQTNSEYYKLLMCNGLEKRKDAKVCSLERLEISTSEHTLKNTDTFVVVFSLATGRVVYASEQASSILNCKRKFLDSAKFVELLFHQDVNVFYSHTAQPHLPPWNVGTDGGEYGHGAAQRMGLFLLDLQLQMTLLLLQ